MHQLEAKLRRTLHKSLAHDEEQLKDRLIRSLTSLYTQVGQTAGAGTDYWLCGKLAGDL